MSTSPLARHAAGSPLPRATPRRIAVARAVLALAWAVALVLAVGDGAPTTDADVPVGAALLLASYPLIDAVASLASAASGPAGRALRLGGAVSVAGALAVGVAALGTDAGATLVTFGAWAAVSGLLQLVVTLRRRATDGLGLPLLVSGALSTLAGVGFAAMAGGTDAHLAQLAGYMALGAVLFLVWAVRARRGR